MKKVLSNYEDILYSDKFFLFTHLLKTISVMIFFVHILACLFYGVGSITADLYPSSWITSTGVIDDEVNIKYIESMYWAFTTMITVGYGDIHPFNTIERLFGLLAIMISASVYAYSLNTVGKLVSNYNNLASSFKEDMVYVN